MLPESLGRRYRLGIPNDISFATGRHDIQPGLLPILDQFAQGLNQQMSIEVRIVGHTDNKTEAGRARNRRIDIFLAERAQR